MSHILTPPKNAIELLERQIAYRDESIEGRKDVVSRLARSIAENQTVIDQANAEKASFTAALEILKKAAGAGAES